MSMPDLSINKLLEKVDQVSELYHRLILLVAPTGGGKTDALRGLGDQLNVSVININLELSRRMLDLTERQRPLRLPELLNELFKIVDHAVILLDNIEILFEISLRQDPLRLLQGLSRNKTVVAAWNGEIISGKLTYAVPDHPEFKKYDLKDLIVVSLS
jgi:hypothetical protein